jgi:hypothetical protein
MRVILITAFKANSMKRGWLFHCRGQILKVVAVACLLIIILPLFFATIYNVSLSQAMGLVGSTFALECFAIPLGIGLKLPPVYVFLTVVSTGIGILTLVLGIFQLLGQRSQRVVNFLLKLRGRARRLQKYGVYGLIPGAVLLSVYGCAAIVWTLGWDVRRSIFFTSIGFVLVSTILLFLSMGVLKVI